MSRPFFSIIIPCYNEVDNLDKLMASLVPLVSEGKFASKLEFIIVENGSTDRSKDLLAKKIENQYQNIRIVYVEKNRGYGYGIQQGLKAALGEYVGWIHADGQVPFTCLQSFFELINQEKLQLFVKGLRSPKQRTLTERFFTYAQGIFCSIFFGAHLFDITAMPVVFCRKLITSIDKLPNDFSIDTYVYWQAVKQGYQVKRIPVKYEARSGGKSSWNTGLMSKIKLSSRLIKDCWQMKKGQKVL